MKALLTTIILLTSSVSFAQPSSVYGFNPTRVGSGARGYVAGTGAAIGLMSLQVCTQTAGDTTPGVGYGFGPMGFGCNVMIMSDTNSGATAITTFDGVPPSTPGTPGSILYVVGPATAANPTTIADASNFELELAWSAPLTGDETRVLILECIAANTFVEVSRHNGARYFDDTIQLAGTADFESYMAIGNGSALAANKTLIVDRDFAASNGRQLEVFGQITVDSGAANTYGVVIAPEATIINDGGPSVHPVIATMEIREPQITETVGTVTEATTLRILSAPSEGDVNYALHVVAGATLLGGGLTMGNDLDMADNNILNTTALYQEAAASDVAADMTTIKSGNAYNRATVNTGGAPLYVAGGAGMAKATCLFASGDQTVMVFTACDETGCTPTTVTEDTGTGGDWDCITDDNTCCDAAETYIDGLGLRFTTTCVANVLWADIPDTVTHFELTSANGAGAGTAFVVVDGAEGQILVLPGSPAAPAIASASDIDSGTHFVANGVALGGGGILGFLVQSNRITAYHEINSTARIYDSDSALNFGNTYAVTQGGVTGSVGIGKDAGGISGEAEGVFYFMDDVYMDTNLYFAVGTAVIQNNATGAGTTVRTINQNAASSTGGVSLISGNQGHVSDVDSGTIYSCLTGSTATDGDTGDCIAQTGPSGDGTGADAGDHIWNVNGANLAFTIYGDGGDAKFENNLSAVTYTNTTEGQTALFSSANAAAAATGAGNYVTGNVTGVGDFASGNWTGGSGDSSNTAGDSGNTTWKSGDAADDSGDLIAKIGVATGGTSGDFYVLGDGVNEYFRVVGETGDIVQTSAKGATTTQDALVPESVTFPGGGGAASQTTTGSIIPLDFFLIGVSYRVVTAGTTCAGFDIGVAGGVTDLFGEDIAVADTITGTTTTAHLSNPQFDGPWEIIVTGTDGAGTPANCVDLEVAIQPHGWSISAPTSD